MAGTPEEDLLGWLEREEERLGISTMQSGLEDIDLARKLLYDELGYDITEQQFEGLKQASDLRYEELPSIGVSYKLVEQSWGFQAIYRDLTTGRFISSADVNAALDFLRGS